MVIALEEKRIWVVSMTHEVFEVNTLRTYWELVQKGEIYDVYFDHFNPAFDYANAAIFNSLFVGDQDVWIVLDNSTHSSEKQAKIVHLPSLSKSFFKYAIKDEDGVLTFETQQQANRWAELHGFKII